MLDFYLNGGDVRSTRTNFIRIIFKMEASALPLGLVTLLSENSIVSSDMLQLLFQKNEDGDDSNCIYDGITVDID